MSSVPTGDASPEMQVKKDTSGVELTLALISAFFAGIGTASFGIGVSVFFALVLLRLK